MAYEASVLAVLDRLKETHSIRDPRLHPKVGIGVATITQIGEDRFHVKSRITSLNSEKAQSFGFQYECILARNEDKFSCEGVFIGEGYFHEW